MEDRTTDKVLIAHVFISETPIVIVFAMTKNNTELRYDRLVSDLENLERKRDRKIKQILAVRKKLGMVD